MAKQLNVDLRFNADVSAAKAQLQDLQTSINQLTTSMATQGAQLGITPKIQEAQQAAVQLKTALSQSMNIETGKFDLSKFNSSLKSMNTDLGKLKTQLTNLGPSGQQTFMTLAQSIMTAEIPTKRISASLAALGTTLKNTAKWQLSSSMLHGFMSAVQTSYRYAQDLNTSLNNIRIVTGESTEAMDKFAARANKAAKALSASTLDYTDAALIFYQQGLQGKDVEKRAEITLKMANVSRQSAEIVSDQLTAVWNNFANGTDSLESFADKMVALGAATASSSDEIAGGLEKFAAVGETIGLSFDYAAAALATITSNTRQSEEVVGTALKTIFARIQGLKLGETLEDGTTLNKYSQALETVGVHIYNANGGLKNMDTILDETAAKWNTLTDDQKAALAQTVAGVRQYNQFISLMDNWESKGPGDKDSMKANLETINKSTGALQEQADIYAESWEAASKRVKASAEEVYMDLLDDDFFIDLTNGLADFLGLLDNLLDSMGGARGLLTGLSSILLNMFAGSAAKGLENMVYNFRSFVGLTEKEAMSTKQAVMNEVRGIAVSANQSGKITAQQSAYFTGMEGQLTLQESLLGVQDKLNDSEKLQAKYIMEQNAAYAHQVELLGLAADRAKDKAKNAEGKFIENIDKASLNSNFGEEYSDKISRIGNAEDVVTNMRQMYFGTDNSIDNAIGATSIKEFKFDQERTDSSKMTAAIDKYVQELTEAAQELEGIDAESQLAQKMREYANTLDERKKALINSDGTNKPGANEGFKNIIKDIQNDTGGNQRKLDLTREQTITDYGKNRTRIDVEDLEGQDLEEANKLNRKLSDSVDNVVTGFKEEAKTSKEASEGVENLGKSIKESEKQIKGLGNTTQKWSQTMVGVAQSAMSLSFAVSSLNSLKNTWADETIGTGEKLLQTFMSLGMAIPMLINGINGLKTAYMGSATVQGALNLVTQTRIGLQQQDIATMTAEELHQKTKIGLEQAQIAITNAKIVQKTQELATTGANIAAMTAEELAEKTGMTTKQAGMIISALKNKANLTEALSEAGLAGSKTAGAIATKIATVANWGFLASMKPLLAITLVLVAALASLALIIWGVTAAFKAIVNSTPEAKLKAAKEESQALSEQLNKAKEEANNLKAAFDDYDEVAKKLGECTKGTEEWNEALQENNNKVLELMDKYPKLASTSGAIGIGKDGQLVISEDARKSLIKEANDRVATAQYADSIGKQKVRDMEIDQLQKKVDSKSNYSGYSQTDQGLGSTTAGGYTYYNANFDTDAKKIFDAAANKYGTNNIGVDEVKAIIKELKESNQLAKGLDDSKLRNQTMDLVNSEKELADAVRANTIATQAETAASAGAIMASNEDYQKSDYKGNIDLIVGANGFNQDSITVGDKTFEATGDQSAEQVLANDYKNRVADSNWWSFGAHATKDANAVFDEYLQYMGMDRFNMENIDFTGDAVYYNAIDPTTGEISDKKTKIDFDTIATTLAAKDAQQGAADYGAIITKQMNSFENQDQADIFTAALTSNESFLSEELLSKTDDQINEIVDSMQISDKTLKAMGHSEEEILKNGAKIKDEFKEQTKELIQSRKVFDGLADNYSKYIVDVKKGGKEAKTAAKNMADQLETIFKTGTELDDIVTPEFIEKNEGLFNDFVNGVEGSADRMREAIGKEILIKAGLNTDEFNNEYNNLQNAILQAKGTDLLNLEIGASLNDQPVLDSLTNMMNQMIAAGYTAEQAGQMMVDALGIDVTTEPDESKQIQSQEYVSAIPEEKTIKGTYAHPVTGEPVETTYSGVKYKLNKETLQDSKTTTVTGVKVTNAKKSAGGNINKKPVKTSTPSPKNPGSINPGGSGGGGGGSSSKPAKKSRLTKKTDIVDRYKEITDQLNKIKDTIEDTSREMDTLWGPKRLKAMDKYGKSLQKQIQTQGKYKQEIVDSLAIDKKAVQDFMKEMPNGEIGGLGDMGLQFTFDEDGYITNYTDVMTTLHAKLNEMENYKNSLGTEEAQSEYEDSTLGPFKERIDELKDLIGQYDDTNQLLMDADNEYQEMIIEWQQNNYDQIVYKVELQVEFSELQLEQVEYYLNKIQDDWYSAAESVTLYGDQIVPLTGNIQSYIGMLDELKTKLNNNEINQAQYMEGLKEVQSGLIDNINTLQDALESVGEYYLNTLDQINEKLDIQTSKFDGLTSVLEHYKEITTLINGEKDYKTLNNIVKSQRKLAEDQLAVSERKLTMYENQKAQVQSEIDKAKLLQDDEIRKQTLDKLEQDMAEIDNLIADEQSSIMEHITTLAELAMEELTNTLAEAKKRMEKAILGGEGLSIDSMLSQIERLNTKQEEYLTNTNKLYETNKLIRQAQMDMDKTDNQRAKQHYNDYIKYIEQLQQSGQLTQFELEMAQAEYDVLQKKIALEEAQEAKNQVRLTRDSEGNYGYVYTANQENIDKAEQEFADAQNARYNKALEGAKKYQDQYYQAIADMESALEELEEERANHLITDEEYEKRRAEIVDTYLTIAETSYELYFKATGIMMEESSNNLLDYELKGVGNMENLRDATERYIEDSNKAFTTYDQKIDEVALHSEENFGKVEEGVGDVEKASQDLVLEINNNLIPTMENELAETLTNSMNQWYALATAIKTAREEAEKAMDVIQKETKLEGGFITDYSDEIAKELEKGEKADYEYINSLLAARDKKMGYLDTYDYSQMMEDYLAGGGKGTDAMYKAYELLRKHKIDMWNNIDFDQMLKDYLASNGKIDDEKAKKILEARAQKINVLGITGVISNEELIKQLTGGNISTTTETATVSEEKKEDSAAAPDLVVGNKIEVKSGTKWYGSSSGTGGTGTAKSGTIKYISEGSNYPYNIDGLGWIKKSDIVGYNTGGYTGDWGPEGKLAILHEKELVLNAQDTENFLGGIAVLREINQMLDNNALIASLGAINLHAMTIGTPADQILQQEVTIHADFPNVTDHNEIEIAIDNLINAASQHAYQV